MLKSPSMINISHRMLQYSRKYGNSLRKAESVSLFLLLMLGGGLYRQKKKWRYKNYLFLLLLSDADTKNDQWSVERRLDQPLVLLVKQTLGDSHWVFPQGPRQEGESMRQVVCHTCSQNSIIVM